MVNLLIKYQGHQCYAHVLVKDITAFRATLSQIRTDTETCADLPLVSGLAAGQPNGKLTDDQLKMINSISQTALKKLDACIAKHRSWNFFKTAQLFDPYHIISFGFPKDLAPVLATIPFAPTAPDVLLQLKAEIVKYQAWVKSDGLPVNPNDFDVFSFWLHQTNRLPNLRKLALRVLSIPVSSADAERSFSTYNYILNHRRTNMSNASARTQVLIAANNNIKTFLK
jgi:hypothetical protein